MRILKEGYLYCIIHLHQPFIITRSNVSYVWNHTSYFVSYISPLYKAYNIPCFFEFYMKAEKYVCWKSL